MFALPHPNRKNVLLDNGYFSKAFEISLTAASTAFDYVPINRLPNLPLLSLENQPAKVLTKMKGWVDTQRQGKNLTRPVHSTQASANVLPPTTPQDGLPQPQGNLSVEFTRQRTISTSSSVDTTATRGSRKGHKIRFAHRNKTRASIDGSDVGAPNAIASLAASSTPPREISTAAPVPDTPSNPSPTHLSLPSPSASASSFTEPDLFLTESYGTPPPPSGLAGRTMSRIAYIGAWTTGKALQKVSNITEAFVQTIEPVVMPIVPVAAKVAQRVPGISFVASKVNAFIEKNQPTVSQPSKLYQLRNNVWSYAASIASSVPGVKQFVKKVDSKLLGKFSGVTKSVLSRYRVNADSTQRPPLSFSFSGGAGWMFAYELGAASCLKELIKPWLLKDMMFLGSSSGALVAACLALNIEIDSVLNTLIDAAVVSSQRLLGPVCSMHEAFQLALEKHIPDDITPAQSRLFVSLTHVPSFSNTIVGKFTDRQNLIDYLLASNNIPLLFEKPAHVDGEMYLDGMLSETRPRLNDFTITISPIPGKANVSPALDATETHSFFDAVLPSSDPEYYRAFYKNGYDDMRTWLGKQIATGVLTRLVFRRQP